MADTLASRPIPTVDARASRLASGLTAGLTLVPLAKSNFVLLPWWGPSRGWQRGKDLLASALGLMASWFMWRASESLESRAGSPEPDFETPSRALLTQT